MHCFSAPEREKDLQAIYALALMRRPDPELLRQMLDEPDLELRLQTLRQRYSFILVEQWRLDEKLNRFLRAYLLNGLRRTSDMVQNLNKTAIAWLSLQLESKTNGITDTADRLKEEAIAELGLDLAHHYGWQGEDDGWRYLVPRFIEGWQYSRTWARGLVEVAESFRPMMGQDNQKRLNQLAAALADLPETESLQRVLDDLQTLERRGWLDDTKAELTSILRLKQGQIFYRQGRNSEALSLYSQLEGLLPAHGVQLKKDLADALSQIGWDLSVVNSRPVPSPAAKEALTKATKLDPSNGYYLIALGVAQVGLKQYLPALENLLTGIRLEGEQAYSLNSLGNVYSDLKRYDEAIAAYQQAIHLDPTYAYHHNG
jgi:tetratricopeptide (TPR) repeat protein